MTGKSIKKAIFKNLSKLFQDKFEACIKIIANGITIK